MKVQRRFIPLDMMSAVSKGRRVAAFTVGHRILLSANEEIDGRLQPGVTHDFSFDEFYDLINSAGISRFHADSPKQQQTKIHQKRRK